MKKPQKPVKLLLLALLIALPLAFSISVPLAMKRAMKSVQQVPDFHAAAQRGDLPQISKLLASGHSVDESMPPGNPLFPEGMTPLMTAARDGNTEVVKLLLNAGADVSKVDSAGNNALDYARQFGNHELIDLLSSQSP